MKDVVLIATQAGYDLHAAVVEEELQKRGVDCCQWDSGSIQESICSYRPESAFNVRVPGVTLDSRSVRSVWIRRPTAVGPGAVTDPDYRTIVQSEWQAFASGFWLDLESRSRLVSRPHAIRQAELKTEQLHRARSLGLSPPDTLITNDHAAVVSFYDSHPDGVIAKKLRSHQIIHGDGSGAIFVTKRLRLAEIVPEQLAVSPLIFQQCVKTVFDVRVIVIDHQCFAFSMLTRSGYEDIPDYRARAAALRETEHSLIELPDTVAAGCVALVHAFGLVFGAIDLAITDEGDYRFFELNPNGQWLWLQIMTRFPLAARMADLLAREK
jgi:glutathione synthase/RimK-type ligase-like ATP-grasp enzyme